MTNEEIIERLDYIENAAKEVTGLDKLESESLSLLAVQENAQDTELYCRTLVVVALVLYYGESYEKALPYAEQASNSAEILSHKKLLAKANIIIGHCNFNFRNFNIALVYYSQSLDLYEEINYRAGIAEAIIRIGYVHINLGDYAKSLEYLIPGLSLLESSGNSSDIGRIINNIASNYNYLGIYTKALEYYKRALDIAEKSGDNILLGGIIGNIGIVYGKINEDDKSLEYFKKGLLIAEELNFKPSIAIKLLNIGKIFQKLGDYDNSMEYFNRAQSIYEELKDTPGIALTFESIGYIYYLNNNHKNALMYYKRALALHEDIGHKRSIANALCLIGLIYSKADSTYYEAGKAEDYLKTSLTGFEELGCKADLSTIYSYLSEFYAQENRWQEAFEHYKKYHELYIELHDEDTLKQARVFDAERKEAEREKQTAVERTRSKERENILNNILPEDITVRLIKGENPIADYFDGVSILFMDIVNFTSISAKLSPRQLVYLLNIIFTKADTVIQEFGLEKIKTIGDAYMAAAGAPVTCIDHAYRAAKAALTLRKAMNDLKVNIPVEYGDINLLKNIPEIQVRIGIHCGSAAAGIVGENKFAYDIWGDTVNTASRMESYGTADKIHISEDFMKQIKDYSDEFNFTERGSIGIKGKGQMKTYFLE